MKLIAIRHGETEWNKEGREMGQLDSPLTKHGIQQAKAIAKRLSHYQFAALYSSDLGRAVHTAKIISDITGVDLTIDIDLRERHMGIFQGLTNVQMAEQFPKEYEKFRAIGQVYQIPNGESGLQRLDRSMRVLSEIANRHLNATIVVVTHGGFLMGFFEYVLGLEPGNSWRFKKQNASYNSFDYDGRKWSLETWNDTSHLEGLSALDDPTCQHEIR